MAHFSTSADVLAALPESDRTGVGQIIDFAILDVTAHSLTIMHTMLVSAEAGCPRSEPDL